MNPHEELRRRAYEGLARLKAKGRLLYPEERYVERIERELDVFETVSKAKKIAPGYGNWADFILVTADYANTARARGVYLGPARGSAAASVVCYCVGITSVVDPIRFRLIFERFLNPARVSSPDIDLDFSDQDVVFAYLEERYGKNRVVRISAPQYMKAKGALRQAGMVLNVPLNESIAITAEYERVENEYRLLDQWDDVDPKLIDEALARSERLAEWEREYPKMFYIARRFVGMLQSHSTHPAGVLVTHGPAGAEVPLMRIGSGDTKGIRTAWDCKALEGVGYVKLDVLNVTNLTIITETIAMVRERHGVRVDPDEIPLEDKRTAQVFAAGDVVGIFQVGDNPIALQMAKELPVETVDDVALINAAIRPGIEWQRMIENKRDPGSVYYALGGLEEILSDSYGVFTYQEQIMFAVQRIGGFSMEEADQVRRVIATTSNAALQYDIDVYRERFVSGGVEKGHSQSALASTWDQIKALANYCFNRSHAVAYGIIAWQEAYLKARWPAEYLCACMNDVIRKKKRESYEKFVADAKRHGIEVVPPGVNRSRGFCFVDGGKIVLGLRMILNVGSGADRIAAHAPYQSFGDFLERAAVASAQTKGSVVGALFQKPGEVASPQSMDEVTSMLVKAGAFDVLHPRREILGACFPEVELTAPMIAAWEQEAVAFFCTSDPLADFAADMVEWIKTDSDRRRKGISGGLVLATHTSKSGTGFLKIRTRETTVDFVCWSDEWKDIREKVRVGMIVTGTAFKTRRDNYALSNLGELVPERRPAVV